MNRQDVQKWLLPGALLVLLGAGMFGGVYKLVSMGDANSTPRAIRDANTETLAFASQTKHVVNQLVTHETFSQTDLQTIRSLSTRYETLEQAYQDDNGQQRITLDGFTPIEERLTLLSTDPDITNYDRRTEISYLVHDAHLYPKKLGARVNQHIEVRQNTNVWFKVSLYFLTGLFFATIVHKVYRVVEGKPKHRREEST